MKQNKEHLWQAYLDGELSAIEAADFEALLSDSEQARLMADVRFERGLAERLSVGAECPEEVWARTRELIAGQDVEAAPLAARRRRWYLGAGMVAAAAALAIVISPFVNPFGSSEASVFVMSAANVEVLSSTSEVEEGHEFAERFIHDHGIELAVLDANAVAESRGPFWRNRHWTIRVVGAREEAFKDGALIEVLVDCCQYPMKILFASVDSDAAREIELAAAKDGDVQSTRVVGEYLVAVVGRHKSHQLLDLVAL